MWIEGRAVYRDATGSPGRTVTVALDVRGLSVRGLDGAEIGLWPFGMLYRLKTGRDVLALACIGDEGVIEIGDPASRAAFAAALKAIPREGQSTVPRSWLVGCAAALVILAGIVAAILWALSSAVDALAPLVPDEIVRAIDRGAKAEVLAALGTSEDKRCTSLTGNVALSRLSGRLADAGAARAMDLDVSVYPSNVANAVALPAGSIIVTDALVKRAGSPDALAGVVAHEIGHVHHRHGIRRLLHEGGMLLALSLLTGDAGGLTAVSTRMVVGAAYSREAEREADRFAVDAVAAAGGNPGALGPFLQELSKDGGEDGGLASFLATHPLSDERRRSIDDRAADRTIGAGPILDAAAWRDLKAICDG